jgi:hypothetical protein
MTTFLVAHGAWSAGWVWKKMRPLLRERGHGGTVATGVADRAPERLAQLVYRDAFVPCDGQCQFDLPISRDRKPFSNVSQVSLLSPATQWSFPFD